MDGPVILPSGAVSMWQMVYGRFMIAPRSPRLVRGTDGELADGGVRGLVDRVSDNVRDPLRRDAVLVVETLHLVVRCLVADLRQQFGIDGGRIDRRGADVGAFH